MASMYGNGGTSNGEMSMVCPDTTPLRFYYPRPRNGVMMSTTPSNTPLVTVPLQVSPELLAKAKAALGANTKRVKLTWALDSNLNINVGLGVKPTSWFTVGVYGQRDASGNMSGAVVGEISFAPAP